jgi:hypothetical protein
MRQTSKSIVKATVFVLLFSAWLQISRGEQPESLIVTVIHVDDERIHTEVNAAE